MSPTIVDGGDGLVDSSQFLKSYYANYLIFGSSVLSLIYAAYSFWSIKSMEMTKDTIKVHKLSDREKEEI